MTPAAPRPTAAPAPVGLARVLARAVTPAVVVRGPDGGGAPVDARPERPAAADSGLAVLAPAPPSGPGVAARDAVDGSDSAGAGPAPDGRGPTGPVPPPVTTPPQRSAVPWSEVTGPPAPEPRRPPARRASALPGFPSPATLHPLEETSAVAPTLPTVVATGRPAAAAAATAAAARFPTAEPAPQPAATEHPGAPPAPGRPATPAPAVGRINPASPDHREARAAEPTPAVVIGRIEVHVDPPAAPTDPFAGCRVAAAGLTARRGGGW